MTTVLTALRVMANEREDVRFVHEVAVPGPVTDAATDAVSYEQSAEGYSLRARLTLRGCERPG